jgi:heat shock protein HtpX
VVLVVLFPLLLCAMTYAALWLVFLFAHSSSPGAAAYLSEAINSYALLILPCVIGFALFWMLISYFCGDRMMMYAAGAQEIHKKDNPLVFSLVENVAITAGLPAPKVFIIPDDSANAFATGRSPQTASVAFTSGIIKRLDKRELEAVVAHEMGHIANRDVRLMMIVITGIGAISFLGELLLHFGARSRRGEKGNALIPLLGLVLMIYGLVLAPLIMYALSRRREFQADASSALLTRDPEALANALIKISKDSRVEALDSMSLMSVACIASAVDKKGFGGLFMSMFNTHPPVSERVRALKSMSGRALYPAVSRL